MRTQERKENRITEEQEAEVLRLFQNGESVTGIGRAVGCHRNTVYRVLGDFGLRRQPGSQYEQLLRASLMLSKRGLAFVNQQITAEDFMEDLSLFETNWKEL